MAELTPINPGNPYDGGVTDQVFTAMTASTTFRWTGKEVLIFKTSDDLTGDVVISAVASNKTKRTGDITITIAAGAGKYAVWGNAPHDGFLDQGTGMITVDALANGEMMIIRPSN